MTEERLPGRQGRGNRSRLGDHERRMAESPAYRAAVNLGKRAGSGADGWGHDEHGAHYSGVRVNVTPADAYGTVATLPYMIPDSSVEGRHRHVADLDAVEAAVNFSKTH